MSVGHRHQDVVGLQVSVDYKNRDRRTDTTRQVTYADQKQGDSVLRNGYLC